ncbi:DUF4270 family protein [Chitinophaga barathri]|nr:DUF4270 family protein [Chitinophaga barathri]
MKRLSILAAMACLTACDKSGFSYDNVVDGGNVQYSLLDTLQVQMRTVQLDSVRTSGTGTGLVGSYADPVFGKFTSHTTFRLGLPPATEPGLRAIYDSLELVIWPDGHYYGDTLPPQRFQVYQLTRPLLLPDEYFALFSHQDFPIASAPLADVTQYIRPTSGKALHLRLDDAKGIELFEMIRNKSDDLKNEDYWRDYFKGLSIRGVNNTAAFRLLMNDTAVVMRLHYHIANTTVEEKTIDFRMNLPELQFNTFRYDRTGTAIAGLQPGPDGISGEATGNKTFSQPLTGAVTRIDFPSIAALQELGRYGRIMSAELVIKPDNSTLKDYPLPPRLTLTLADKKNFVTQGDTLSDAAGVQYGNLRVDKLYPENNQYSWDVTAYCRAMMTADVYTYRGLLLAAPFSEFHTQLNRIVVGDGNGKQYRAQLKIYYLLYE